MVIFSVWRGNPEWNQELDFGVGYWEKMEVSVWNEDLSRVDHPLSGVQSYLLPLTEPVGETAG